MSLVIIKHTGQYKGINAGETAGWPENVAKYLVKEGLGIVKGGIEESKIEEIKKKTTPEAQLMLTTEQLMDKSIKEIKEELNRTTSEDTYLYNEGYVSEALDYESLNKGRSGLMDYLLEEMDGRT